MKTAIAAALMAAFLSAPASARGPIPFPPFPPPHHDPAPAPKPEQPTAQQSMKDILSVKTELVAILQEVVKDQAGVINSGTPMMQSWDAALVMCLNGNPGSGTPGQPGYVAPMPGLISWLQSLPTPTLETVPPIVDPSNVAEVAEHARLVVLAGIQDASSLVNILQSNGSSLKTAVLQPCGSFMQDTFVNVPTEIAGQIAAIALILKPYIPAAMALHEQHAAHH